MRGSVALLGLLVACGAPSEGEPAAPERASDPPPAAIAAALPAAPEVPLQTIVSTPRLLVEVPLALVEREGTLGLAVRVTNRSDAPLLADLRSRDRVFGVGEADRPHMPLTEAQRTELSLISALTSIAPHETIEYAVPVPDLEACEGERRLPLSGVLVVLDGDRVSELVADGASVVLPCATEPSPRAPGTIWVAESAPLAAASRALETYGEGFAPLVRAASVDPEADIALLAFSYDARPVERFRFDACVAVGRCPARVIPQPTGSLHTPAVGMSWEAADAFCATRGLHVASEAERAAIADASRALVTGDASAVVLSGFACVRPETR